MAKRLNFYWSQTRSLAWWRHSWKNMVIRYQSTMPPRLNPGYSEHSSIPTTYIISPAGKIVVHKKGCRKLGF